MEPLIFLPNQHQRSKRKFYFHINHHVVICTCETKPFKQRITFVSSIYLATRRVFPLQFRIGCTRTYCTIRVFTNIQVSILTNLNKSQFESGFFITLIVNIRFHSKTFSTHVRGTIQLGPKRNSSSVPTKAEAWSSSFPHNRFLVKKHTKRIDRFSHKKYIER